jgi:alkylation response protein AidB-like acyl-CoA dehydrogenase
MAANAVALAGDAAQRERWLPPLAAGDAIASCGLDGLDRDHGAGATLTAVADGDAWRLEGIESFVPDAGIADWIVLPARVEDAAAGGLGLFVVGRNEPRIAIEPMRSIDPLRTLYTVECAGTALPLEARLGGDVDAEPVSGRILDLALVMIAAEMLGGAQRCLDSAVEHAKSRVQFGKPIGAYQAIKHKCADMLFELESARSITYYAAWAVGAADDEATLAAAMAKAYVGDAYQQIAGENIQIHGGVGFSWESDCHFFFKRAASDACWLGDSRHHRERVAQLLEI